MDKFLMNKIIQLSAENAVLKNENECLKEQMRKKRTDQSSELELRKRLINLKYQIKTDSGGVLSPSEH